MPDQGTTLNQEQGIPTAQPSGAAMPASEPGASSTFRTSSDDLVSTVDLVPPVPAQADTDPEGANKTGDQPKTAKTEESAEAKPADTKAVEERFDKHPRFQEIHRELKQTKAELQSLKAQLEVKKETPKEPQELPYKDVTKMTKEEILEWQDTDPLAYHQNMLAQAKYELSKEFEGKIGAKSFEDAVASTYGEFAKENPDFDDLWDSGDLKTYMDKHPGHNAISAYYAISSKTKADEAKKVMDDKIAAAVKEAEKKAQEAYRVKRESQVLSSGPAWSGLPEGVSPELKDSKKFGGSTAVLAARAAARMAQRGR